MTTENTLNCQPRTPQHTEAINRFHGILGTGGLKTTGRGNSGEINRRYPLIKPIKIPFNNVTSIA
jgi:hypothetical protein